MEVDKVLHMNKGADLNSYARNSLLQRTIITYASSIIEESIREIYDTFKPECLMMAEMGCSSGPNALLAISIIIDAIDEASRSMNQRCPQIGVFLNDLPSNDFNALFSLLPSFDQMMEAKGSNVRSSFMAGIPKSFYGRVFPDNFLHFGHSSYSVHWLSQVPRGLASDSGEQLNKGNIYIAKTSPVGISKAYYAQFKDDFTLFLQSRSKEMIPRGRMVLIFQGSYDSDDPDAIWELLGSTLQDMVTKGAIDQEKLDSFNMPFYAPTVEEVRNLVQTEGSLVINKLETSTVDWSIDTSQNLENRAKFVARSIRAVGESLLATAFGHESMDELFLSFETRIKERMAGGKSDYLNIMLSMTKKD